MLTSYLRVRNITKAILCLLSISVAGLLLNLFSFPTTSKVPYVPTKTVNVRYDFKVDDSQYVILRYIVNINNNKTGGVN